MARLEKEGFHVATAGESHTKMVKVVEEEGLRPRVVMIPCPAPGEELLAMASLISVLEQTGMNRRQFDGLADPREQQVKPWYTPRLRSLVDRRG